MSKKEVEKRKVLTLLGVIEELGCSRAWFFQKYREQLERLPSTDNKAYYDYEEVKKLKKKIKEPKKNTMYNVLK
jgi:hypothetical protein